MLPLKDGNQYIKLVSHITDDFIEKHINTRIILLNMKPEELTKLGFTENEAKVYLALLESGLSTITILVTKTHFHKQVIYDNLERLMAKGLVSYVIKANRKYFNAVSPEKIQDILKEQEKELQNKERLLQNLLPQLKILKESAGEKQIATIYQDKKGIKSILEDVLKQKEEVLTFGNEGRFKGLFGPYWLNYNQRREKLRLKFKVIWNERLRGKRERLKFIEIKYIPKEFENPASTMIYGNKTAIILWEDVPFAILIESTKITNSYKTTFNLLWNIAKK